LKRDKAGGQCVIEAPALRRRETVFPDRRGGGPATYSEKCGDETAVVRIHSGNGVHEEMDRRAIACFDQALEDVGLSANEQLWQVLHDYFAWATTTTMARYHESADDVPKGLRIPRWSWDGLQG
jgi:hemoglobin